jgi:hypothetical protein
VDVQPQPGSAAGNKPGKIRTWWHPLLAGFLRWQLGSHYHLEEEVPVGQKPLQIDVLLLRKEEGELPEHARRVLAGLAEYFNELTMLELKSPSDTVRAGDFQTFLAYALLYRAQNEPLLALGRLNLLVLAPRLTKPYREELSILGVTPREQQPGAWALEGGVVSHRTWVLETAVLAGLEHPLLTLFSPQFLAQGPQTYAQLHQGGYTELVVYLAQQIQQFQQKGAEFAMQHLGTEDELRQVLRDLVATLPPEERLASLSPSDPRAQKALRDLIASFPLDQRLAGLSPEQRMQGLSPEQVLQGLPPDKLEQLRKLLQPSEVKGGPGSPK